MYTQTITGKNFIGFIASVSIDCSEKTEEQRLHEFEQSFAQARLDGNHIYEFEGKWYHAFTKEEWEALSIEDKIAIGQEAKAEGAITFSTLVDDSMELDTAIYTGREEGADFIVWRGDTYPTRASHGLSYNEPIVTEIRYDFNEYSNAIIDVTSCDDENLVITDNSNHVITEYETDNLIADDSFSNADFDVTLPDSEILF